MDEEKDTLEKLLLSNKIITYKTLAAIFNVTISDAKLILKKYMKDQKEKLNVSHLISGITDDDTYKVSIIPETKYEQAKHSFDFITKDYIYAIQKSELSNWMHVLKIEDLLYEKDKKEVESPQIEIEKLESPSEKESSSSAANKKISQATDKIDKISYFISENQLTNNKITFEKESNKVVNPEKNYASGEENVIRKKWAKSIPLIDDDSEEDTTPEVIEETVNISFDPNQIRTYKKTESDAMYQDDKATVENELENDYVDKELIDSDKSKYKQKKQLFDFITKDNIHAIQQSELSDWKQVLNIEDLLCEKDKKEVQSSQIEIEELESSSKKESLSSAANKKTSQATNKIDKMSHFISENQLTNNKMTLEKESNKVVNSEINYTSDEESVIRKKLAKSIPLIDDDSEEDTTPKVTEEKVNVSFDPNQIRSYENTDSDDMYQDEKTTLENEFKNNSVDKELNDSDDDESIIRKKRTKSIPLVDDESEEEITSPKNRKKDLLESMDSDSEEYYLPYSKRRPAKKNLNLLPSLVNKRRPECYSKKRKML